jgi:glycine dehydrogenase subunit 2
MAEFTMQPLAGAHGELTGIILIAAYHKAKGSRKTKVIIPDSAHGTNPASAAIAGYSVVSVPTDKDGAMDLKKFAEVLDSEVAAVMLTCPNTLGLFNKHIKETADMAHKVDALLYYDGANMNAITGRYRPGDFGFDVVHLNLHKTFGTPHGGGGPGSGPVGVKENLVEFLPVPKVVKKGGDTYALEYEHSRSIGHTAPFYGNFGVILKAYAYILLLGREGLIRVSENAVLNANYLMEKLKSYYHLPYDRRCMHEFVLSGNKQKEKGVRALDIAKRIVDFGFHPPTVYFPLIVEEALMIEPTESEPKEVLDKFIEVMIQIAKESEENPQVLKDAPNNLEISRLDEVKAARELNLKWDKK